MKETVKREKCVDEIMCHVQPGSKLPTIEKIEILTEDYDEIIMQCNLPCDYRFGKDGHPEHKPCSLWDVKKKLRNNMGISK